MHCPPIKYDHYGLSGALVAAIKANTRDTADLSPALQVDIDLQAVTSLRAATKYGERDLFLGEQLASAASVGAPLRKPRASWTGGATRASGAGDGDRDEDVDRLLALSRGLRERASPSERLSPWSSKAQGAAPAAGEAAAALSPSSAGRLPRSSHDGTGLSPSGAPRMPRTSQDGAGLSPSGAGRVPRTSQDGAGMSPSGAGRVPRGSHDGAGVAPSGGGGRASRASHDGGAGGGGRARRASQDGRWDGGLLDSEQAETASPPAHRVPQSPHGASWLPPQPPRSPGGAAPSPFSSHQSSAGPAADGSQRPASTTLGRRGSSAAPELRPGQASGTQGVFVPAALQGGPALPRHSSLTESENAQINKDLQRLLARQAKASAAQAQGAGAAGAGSAAAAGRVGASPGMLPSALHSKPPPAPSSAGSKALVSRMSAPANVHALYQNLPRAATPPTSTRYQAETLLEEEAPPRFSPHGPGLPAVASQFRALPPGGSPLLGAIAAIAAASEMHPMADPDTAPRRARRASISGYSGTSTFDNSALAAAMGTSDAPDASAMQSPFVLSARRASNPSGGAGTRPRGEVPDAPDAGVAQSPFTLGARRVSNPSGGTPDAGVAQSQSPFAQQPLARRVSTPSGGGAGVKQRVEADALALTARLQGSCLDASSPAAAPFFRLPQAAARPPSSGAFGGSAAGSLAAKRSLRVASARGGKEAVGTPAWL